jgi:membrane-associated protease RseP (regulator of RpoE activity)
MNLLPLPILDGGQCLMVLIEKWFPNLLTVRLKNLLALLSVMLLFCLIAVGFHNDWLFLQ